MAAVCVPPQSSVEKSPIFHDAHPVAILFAKQRRRMELMDRHVDRYIGERLDHDIAQHLAVDEVLYLLELFFGHTGEVREVKS